MSKHKVFLVLPKITAFDLNSFNHKDTDSLAILKEKVSKWLEFFLKYDTVDVCCFAEDKLALELLTKEDRIKWFTVLGASDSNYYKICGCATDKYVNVEKSKVKEEIIKKAVKKYSVKKAADFVDEVAFKGHREQVMNNRIRYAVDEVLNDADFIIYFNQNHNYCKEPEPKLGDGKLIINHNLVRMFDTYCYGGVPISFDNLEMIAGGLFNG